MKMKYLFTSAILLITGLCHAEAPNLRTVTEQFQDWQMVCVEKDARKQCRINQTLVNEKGETIAMFNLVKKENGKHLVEIVLPLLLDLTKQVNVTIDEKKTLKYPYNFCNNAACFVIADEDSSLLKAFEKGDLGALGVSPIGKKEVKFNFSLKGFSAALAALTKG